MKIDLSFWRFVIILSFAKSLLWGKNDETYFFHIGLFGDGEKQAFKFIFLPISLMIGYVKPPKQ